MRYIKHRYDIVANSWSTIAAQTPYALAGASGAQLYDNRMYVFTPWIAPLWNSWTQDVLVYDPVASEWAVDGTLDPVYGCPKEKGANAVYEMKAYVKGP